MTTLHTTFPDLHFTVEEEVAEGDKVVGCFTIRGTQRGELFDIPCFDKPVLSVVEGLSTNEFFPCSRR